jgi:hypothetical protein
MCYVHPSIIFESQTGLWLSGAAHKLYSWGGLLAFPANIRLGWNWLASKKVYYCTELIASVHPRPLVL